MSESRILQAFVGVLCGVCLVTTALLRPEESGGWLTLLLLGLFTLLSTAWSVRIRALGLELTPTDPFVLFALVTMGTPAAVLLAVVAVAGAAAWRGRRQRLVHYLFNFSALPLSTAVTGLAFGWAGGSAGAEFKATLLPLCFATGVYLLINTGLTAVAITSSRKSGFVGTWARGLRWTVCPTLVALSVTWSMILLVRAVGTWGLALALPPVFALAASQQVSRVQLEESQAETFGAKALDAAAGER